VPNALCNALGGAAPIPVDGVQVARRGKGRLGGENIEGGEGRRSPESPPRHNNGSDGDGVLPGVLGADDATGGGGAWWQVRMTLM
jgi:hypothetical protein